MMAKRDASLERGVRIEVRYRDSAQLDTHARGCAGGVSEYCFAWCLGSVVAVVIGA